MKIALITIHNANNYGAVLQAYATKKILSQYGEVQTINYDNKHLSNHLDILRFSFSIRGIKMLAHDLLRLPYRISAINKFKNFVSENMNLTKAFTSNELLQGKVGNFDVYVCGSDQIWNPEIVNKNQEIDPIYFLSFATENAKKISYASSIGHHYFSDNEKIEVKNLLNNFTLISTREEDGVKKLQEILPNKTIYHVLDPTLLLSKEEWLNALDIKSKKAKEEYILVYSVPRTVLIKEAVEYFKNKLNMKVITIDQMLFPLAEVDEHIRTAGPKEFVELFSEASFIITDSFHGTCFAINFGKPFISVSPGKASNRIQSLLSKLKIENRLIFSIEDAYEVTLNLDYVQTKKELSSLVDKSKNIIKVSLLEDYALNI